MDIEAAIKYPTNDEEEWVTTVLIGGGIVLAAWLVGFGGFFFAYLVGVFTFGIGFLLVAPLVVLFSIGVSVIVVGYSVKVMRRTIRGVDAPPRFSNLGDLARDGLYGTAIGFVYQIPMFVAIGGGFAAMVVLFGIGAVLESPETAAAGSVIGMLFFVLVGLFTAVYSLAVGYVLPAAICSYAHDGELGAAFDVDRLKEVCLSSEYAIAVVVALGINLVASQVMQFLMFVLVGFFLQFYLFVVLSRIVSQGYADALGLPEGRLPDAGPRDGPEAGSREWVDTGGEGSPGES